MAFIFYVRPITLNASLSASTTSITEGSSVTITLTTTGVSQGTPVAYFISGNGINANDFEGLSSLTGNFIVGANGTASVTLTATADLLTEGAEEFTLALATDSSIKVTIDIEDSKVGAVWDGGASIWDGGASVWDV